MSDTVLLFIGGIVGAILAAFSPLLVAKFSKSRQEKDVALAKEYLSLVDMSADQLERRINLIGKLDERIGVLEMNLRQQQAENEELERNRAERDERIEALEAHTQALKQQIEKDTQETKALRGEVNILRSQVAKRERVIEKLVKALREADISLPDFNGDLGDSIQGLKWPKKSE